MLNALVASDCVLVPVQAHFYALDGLKSLIETIQLMRRRFHPCLVRPLGLLLTFVENRTTLSRRIELGLRELFGSLVFETVIHKTTRLAEAPSVGQTVLTYAPDSRGAERRWPARRWRAFSGRTSSMPRRPSLLSNTTGWLHKRAA